MKITMRLYRLHDVDLMYLYKMPSVSLQKIIKAVLKSYVQDRVSPTAVPERVAIPRIQHDVPLPKSAQFHIYLDDKEDFEVVEWIDKVPKGLRNGMIKNILRGYVNFPMTLPYEMNFAETEEQTKSHVAKRNGDNNIKNINSMMANNAKQTVEKNDNKTKKKNRTADDKNKSVADDVLEKPLSDNDNKKKVKTESADEVLNEKPAENDNKNNEKTSKNEDVFSDFEDMMNTFNG